MTITSEEFITSTDINALKDLCDTKASEAGVGITGLGDVSVGDLIQATYHTTIISKHNDLVALSNEADDSQSTVSSGDIITAILHSTMLSQLNAMTFSEVATMEFITGGGSFSVGLDTNGAAWTWGYNLYGQLGDNTTTNRSTPVSVHGGHVFNKIGCGGRHTIAIDSDGAGWAWGSSYAGQLGDNTLINKSTPISVHGGHEFIDISGGGDITVAIDSDGAGWAWGDNFSSPGALGNNDWADQSTPVSVHGGHVFQKMVTGGNHSLGLDSAGAAWAWGDNNDGQLGVSTRTDYSTPISVFGSHVFTEIGIGVDHSFGLDSAGAGWSWGQNVYGQCGHNSGGADVSFPASVLGGHVFDKITANYRVGGGIDSAGAAWAWGRNDYGQLGDNTEINRSTPVSVHGGHVFTKISFGSNHSLGLDDVNQIWAWGYNSYGQLGDNTTISKSTPVSVVR